MSETRWLEADQQQTWRTFLEATSLLFDVIDRQLQTDAGLSHADYELLVRLSEAPQRRLRMSELAERALFSRSRLSHAVARLEREGWVERTSCPVDKRGTFATLTKTGFAKLKAAAPGHVETVRQGLVDPLDDAQLSALATISAAIRDHLTPTDAGSRESRAAAPLSRPAGRA